MKDFVHKFVPMPQMMKIPEALAAAGQGVEKARDNPSMEFGQSQEQKEVILEAQKDTKKVHFAAFMDICHHKNVELETKLQKYKGRVVLRGDIVKDDSAAYAFFTEQGSSASQMTAATIIDVIARLPNCDGQAADAVSGKTHVKIGGCSQIAPNS